MDNVTHSLTGLALARAGLNRICPHATALLVLSANAPDFDFAAAAMGGFRYFEVHRGYSHCVAALPLVAGLCMLVIAAAFRQKLQWGRAFLVCLLGVASHLLIDWTNNYGIRLGLPFSSRWFHLDLNSLYDGAIMAALALAALWVPFSHLISHEIGEGKKSAGRAIAIAALLFFVLFDIGRFVVRTQVVAQVQDRLYDGEPPLSVAAFPTPFNPLRWAAAVETRRKYLQIPTDGGGDLQWEMTNEYFKPPQTPALAAVTAADPFRYFLYFARFPVWAVQEHGGTHGAWTRFDLSDLRFGSPGRGSFHCIAVVDADGHVKNRWFTYGPGVEFGIDE